MPIPNIYPLSKTHTIRVSEIGDINQVDTFDHPLPFRAYTNSNIWSDDEILSYKKGSVEFLTFAFRRLAGSSQYIELTNNQVYTAYEEACIECSYILNMHQGRNNLMSLLGEPSATFDSNGDIIATLNPDEVQPGVFVNLKFIKLKYNLSKRVAQGFSDEMGQTGYDDIFMFKLNLMQQQQEYDLQKLIYEESISNTESPYFGKVSNKRLHIKKIYYKSPRTQWRFYGYFGNPQVMGSLSTYGQFADDSTFEVVPTWQNKLQAMAYEDSLHTRISHYSFRLKNNKIKVFPVPYYNGRTILVEFMIPTSSWEEPMMETDAGERPMNTGISGSNNIVTLPYGLWKYTKTNQIGKRFIQQYALGLVYEMLSIARGKYSGNIPIPNASVTLNSSDLSTKGAALKENAKKEFMEILNETLYKNVLRDSKESMDANRSILSDMPYGIDVD